MWHPRATGPWGDHVPWPGAVDSIPPFPLWDGGGGGREEGVTPSEETTR